MSRIAVILPAAGQSRRFEDKFYKKTFVPLAGRAVWMHSAERFVNRDDVQQVIVVIAPEDRDEFDRKFAANVAIQGIDVCNGGAERADSVENALALLSREIDLVAIHDAARPCLAETWITRVFEAAQRDGAAILALPITDTIKQVGEGNKIDQTVDRANLWAAQTPQVFRRELIVEAYKKRGDQVPTDDAELVQRLGHPVTVVTGSSLNLKITTREDLKLAEQVLKVLPKPKLEGFSHPFADDNLWR